MRLGSEHHIHEIVVLVVRQKDVRIKLDATELAIG